MADDKTLQNNKELRVLGTHAAGAIDMFETRHTDEPQVIEAPEEETTGSQGTY